MSLHEHEALFAGGLGLLLDAIDDDAQLARAVAALLDRADYFDVADVTSDHAGALAGRGVDLEAARRPKAKRWSVDKLGRHLLAASWEQAQCQTCIDWYLVLGWTLAADDHPTDKLRGRRDVGKMRLIVADARSIAPGYRSVFDVLQPGPFTDWWLEPLLDDDSPGLPAAEVEAALEHLENIAPWEMYEPELDDLAHLGPDGWLDAIIVAGPQVAPRLLAISEHEPPHRALLAAVLLYHAVRKHRKALPLSAVALPLYRLCEQGNRDLEARNRGEQSDAVRWVGGLSIRPRGDLWEWLTSHVGEYGDRLEPWLAQRVQHDWAERTSSLAFSFLDSLAVDRGGLAPETHAKLMTVAEQLTSAPPDDRGSFDPVALVRLYELHALRPHVVDDPPACWPAFLELAEQAMVDTVRAECDRHRYPMVLIDTIGELPGIGGTLSDITYNALADLVRDMIWHFDTYRLQGLYLHSLFAIFREAPDRVPAPEWDELRGYYPEYPWDV
jgi:hypothetical protein